MAPCHLYENGLYKVFVVAFPTLFLLFRIAAFFPITGVLFDLNGLWNDLYLSGFPISQGGIPDHHRFPLS